MREILGAKISFISLCPRGRNKMPVIFKADDGTVEMATLSKFDKVKGELLAVVYAPNVTDTDGDFASADVIKQMAYEYARGGAQVDIKHDGKAIPRDKAFIAEHFIIEKGDRRFADWKDYDGTPVDVTGGWAVVVKIDDEGLKAKYGDEGWNGVSMFGDARVRQVKEETTGLKGLLKALRDAIVGTPEDDMTPDQVTKAVTDAVTAANKPLADALVGLTTVLKAQVPGTPAAPVAAPAAAAPAAVVKAEDAAPQFTGDPMNAEDVTKFEKAVESFELRKALNDPDPAKRTAAIAKARGQTVAPAAAGAPSNQPVTATTKKADEGDAADLRKMQDSILKYTPGYVAPPVAR